MLGVGLMMLFCILAPLGDSFAKMLGETIPLIQFLFFRFAIQTVILLPVGLRSGRLARMSRRVLLFAFWRTLCHLVGLGALFASLRFLPLADTTAIIFVLPFLILILGRLLLGDEMGRLRIVACTIGFIGTLMVIQPRFAEAGWVVLLPLVVAFSFAFFMLAARQIRNEVDPITLQAASGAMATGLVGALLPLGVFLEPFRLVPVDGMSAFLIVAMAVLGTIAHLMLTWSLSFASPSALAPIQYFEIPFAVLFGYLFFGDLPGGLALGGIALILAAGLTVLREAGRGPAAPPA